MLLKQKKLEQKNESLPTIDVTIWTKLIDFKSPLLAGDLEMHALTALCYCVVGTKQAQHSQTGLRLRDRQWQKRGQKQCQKGQTVPRRDQKKAQTVFAVFPWLCHTKNHLITKISKKNYLKLRLSLAWHCTGVHYWCFSDFAWFARLHTLGKTVRQFVYWSIGSFLDPYESHLPFTPVLTTRIITAFHLTSL